MVQRRIACTEKNDIITVGKTCCRCFNVVLLKLNKVLPTGMVPRSFVTDDYFLKRKWVLLSLKMTDRPCHCHFTFSQVITNKHNFRASHQGLVPIFYIYPTMLIDNEQIVSILLISCAIGAS